MELKMSKITHFFSVYRFPDKNYTRTIRILYHPEQDNDEQVILEGDEVWPENSAEVYNKTCEVINKLCHGEVNMSNKVAQVKLAAEDGTYNITRENGCLRVDGEKMIKQSEAQAFLSQNPRGRGGDRGQGRHRGG